MIVIIIDIFDFRHSSVQKANAEFAVRRRAFDEHARTASAAEEPRGEDGIGIII